jgi:CubicO group peptidase (beta-lactamase class C family)
VGLYDGEDEYVASFGVTSVENPLEVTSDTLFQIGSTTKTLTGTAIMALVERGMLDLDEPVRTYLPNLRLSDEEVASRVTSRHLLTHVGGWVGDVFEDTGGGDDALEKVVERLADAPQLTPLGEVYSYNNSAFYLAGRVVEVLSGKTFETAARELVLDPLGMDESFFFPGEVMTRRFAVGHLVKGGEPAVSRPWVVPRNAAPPVASPPARRTSSVMPGSIWATAQLTTERGSSGRNRCARCRGHRLRELRTTIRDCRGSSPR